MRALGLALAMGCTQSSPPSPVTPPPSVPGNAATIPDATIAAIAPDAAIAVDAGCATDLMVSHRPDYPAPTQAELKLASGWFFQADRTVMIRQACDLGDRVVMVEGAAPPSSEWIWTRDDRSSRKFAIDEQSGHTGHMTTVSKSAPPDSRVFDVIIEGPDLPIAGGVGRTYGTQVSCWLDRPNKWAETVIACSTAKQTILIDALEPPACSTFPDGIGWPLALTFANRDDRTHAKHTPGKLATISADRTVWTYRFGSTDFVLHLGAKPWAALGDDRCVVLLVDHRRTQD